MTYTFKLSRRLAASHRAGARAAALAAALGAAALMAACGGDATEGLAPETPADGASITALVLAPKLTTTIVGQPARFTAYGRTAAGDSLVLAAEELEWSASGGTITQDGLFSATAAGTYALIARDRRRQRADTSKVVVRPPSVTLTALAVAPEAATVAAGATQAFAATGTFSDGTSAPVTPTWTATGGTIDAAGTYTAGTAAGTYRVVATSADGALADTAVVTIPAPAAPPPPPPPPAEPEPEPDPTPTPTLAAVVLTPEAAALQSGATQQFSAAGRLSDGSTTSSVAVTWTATGGTVSSTGLYTAGSAAGTYRVIATEQGGTLADTAIVTVTAPAPPPPSGSNEPSGYAKITERAFNAKAENGWSDRGDANFSIVQDPNAPRSASNVGQAFYPKGYPSGTGPISTQYSITGGKREIYVSFDVQLSSNWYGQEAGVNKILFFWLHDNPVVCLSAQGAGTGRLEPQVRLQNTPMGSPVLRPNLVASAEIVRGRWQRWELVMKANTPGVADGEVHWWIDGKKVGEHKGIQFSGSGQGNSWQIVDWNPTYGGLGAPVPNDQYQRIDHIYVSGR